MIDTKCYSFDIVNVNLSSRSLHVWPAWGLLDTADTGRSFSRGSNVNVSSVSPVWSPWVSNDVVCNSILGSPSNSSDSVIKVGSTFWRVHDTTGVTLEDCSVCFNGNGNWSLGDGSEKLVLRVSFYGVNSWNENLWCSFLHASSRVSVSRSVWVLSFGNLTVGLNVLHGFSLPSTIASIARGIAGN